MFSKKRQLSFAVPPEWLGNVQQCDPIALDLLPESQDQANVTTRKIQAYKQQSGATNHEHAADEHAADEHVADEHAADEHAADEHVADEHAADEHAADEHVADEHAADEHVADEHAADEHAADEHADSSQIQQQEPLPKTTVSTNVLQAELFVVQKVTVREAIRQLYVDIQIENEIEDPDDDPAVNPSPFERCCDIFCHACGRKKDIMTPKLRRARAKGMSLLKQLVFPFVGPGWRIVWIVFELLLVIVSMTFSVASFVGGSQDVFNLVHLVLSYVSTALALVDGWYSLPRSWKLCRQFYREKLKEKREPAEGQKPEQDINQETQPLLETTSEESSCCFKCRWCKSTCCNCMEKFSDVARTLLAELILVPLLICDIFDFVLSLPTRSVPETIISHILFGCGLIGLVLYVYIVRVTILCGLVHYVQKARKAFVTDPQKLIEANFDPTISASALKFQVFFLIHVIGQMIAQVLMLITVGRAIYFNNQHFYQPDNLDTSVKVSFLLWYLMAATTVLPVVGFFTFFLVANYWAQQFPISFCLDLIKVLKMPGAEEMFDFKSIAKEGAEKIGKKIENFFRGSKLRAEFNEMQDKKFYTKFVYPFKSPGMIIVCCFYGLAQLVFAYFAFSAGAELYNGWLYFYIAAGGVGFIVNMYSFALPIVWLPVIFFIMGLVPPVIVFILPILICFGVFYCIQYLKRQIFSTCT